MSLSRKQREELTKLRVLEYLSNPPLGRFFGGENEGASATDIRDEIRETGLEHRLLPEMQQAGLIRRRDTPGADGHSKPYFITNEGRQYLQEAKQKAMLLTPSQRVGWADEAVNESDKRIVDFLRGLPEFRGREARVQEVARDLTEAIRLS